MLLSARFKCFSTALLSPHLLMPPSPEPTAVPSSVVPHRRGSPNIGFSYNFPVSSYSQGAHTLSFRAIDTNGLVGTASFPITIVSTLGITTTSLPNALVSSPYSQALAATAGTAPYTWTLASGALPPGLSLSGSTISGTPTTAGTYNLTVQATDSSTPSHQSATQALSIYVNSPVSVATASLAGGLVTTAYSQSLAASGGTPGYTWSITTGALPNGLSLNSSGNIFGTPTTAGTANFTVQVTDSTSPLHQTATKALSITIGPALSITTSSLSTGLATTAYSQALATTGGTPAYTWSLASGSLPTGLTLSAAGTISGTPTTAGTFNFSVKATDNTASTAQTATQPLSITIGAAVSITTASLPRRCNDAVLTGAGRHWRHAQLHVVARLWLAAYWSHPQRRRHDLRHSHGGRHLEFLGQGY